MKFYHSFHVFVAFSSTLLSVQAQINAPGAKPHDKPVAPTPFVTTGVKGQSTYTVTFEPTMITAATTLTQGTLTTTVTSGDIVGAVVGGAAVGAAALGLPLMIPEPFLAGGPQPPVNVDGPQPEAPPSPDEPEEPEDKKDQCKKKDVDVCQQDCVKSYYGSNCQLATTTSCSKEKCKKTKTCDDVKPSTSTVLKEPLKHKVLTPEMEMPLPPLPTPAPDPLDQIVLQVYIDQEIQKLHLDYPSSKPDADAEATCEEDTSKAEVEKKGIKDNIKDFCKSNNEYSASPNKELRVSYEQKPNRGQVNLIVAYKGERGQGATYKVEEKTCIDVFNKILTCSTDKDHTRGGSFELEKGVFTIESYIHKGEVKCAPKDQKVTIDTVEATEKVKKFCKNKKKITDKHEESKREFQTDGSNVYEMKVAWTSDPPSCGEGGGLFKDGYPINEDACNRFFTTLLDECKAESTPSSVGGTLVDGCAIYSLTPSSREALVCASDPAYKDEETDSSHLGTFDRGMALDAIDDFCAKDLEFDPKKANSKKGRLEAQTGFSQDGKWSWPKTSKNGITIEVVNGETCDKDTPKENKKFKTGGPACKRKLADLILDGCDTNTRQNKKGGSLLESGYRGCVRWEMRSLKPMKTRRRWDRRW